MNSFLHGIQITTLSGWLACALGYAVGFRVPQTWQLTFAEKPKAMQVITNLDFTLGDPLSDEPSQAASSSSQTTPPSQSLATPQPQEATSPPPLPEIAASQALPEIPLIPAQVIRKVATRIATPGSTQSTNPSRTTGNAASTSNSSTPPSTATTLSFGSGAGRQPAPSYPYQSRRANQQGTVVIEFIVGTDGRVLNAWVKSPSAWPMLNDAALSTVRSRWAFPAGTARRYRIPIVFRLS